MSKKKIIASSVLSLAMCASVVTGATFALFTSESKTNVAISSGKVDVTATLSIAELYSPTTINTDCTIQNAENAATETYFANGGTVSVNGEEITITNMTPGDKVVFEVVIENNSNVNFYQRMTLACQDEDKSFFDQLLVGLSDAQDSGYTYYADYATAWEVGTPVTTATTETKYLSVEMPACVDNDWQAKTCSFALAVNAVQGNAETIGEEKATEITLVGADDDVTDVAKNAEDGAILYINEPVSTVDITYDEAKEITLRGYNIGTLNVNAADGTVHVYNNVGTINGTNVAQHSLYVYGKVGSIVMNNGRVVVENTAKVDVVTLDASAGATVALVIPQTVVEEKTLVGEVKSVVVKEVATDAKVSISASPEVKIEEILSGEGVGDATKEETTGGADSYILDEENKALYLGDAVGLRKFADAVTAGNKYAEWTVYLTADIDLAGENWVAIGGANHKSFSGTFDGQNYTISNMSAVNNFGYGNGFFANILGGTVKNVTFENARVARYSSNTVAGNVYGIVAGYAYGTVTFENVHVNNSSVWAFGKVGGILGMAADPNGVTTFKNCSVDNVTIASAYNAGGLAGLAQNKVEIVDTVVGELSRLRPSSYTYITVDTVTDGDDAKEVKGIYWKYDYVVNGVTTTYMYAAWATYYCDYSGATFTYDGVSYEFDGCCHN